jgi:SUZ domain
MFSRLKVSCISIYQVEFHTFIEIVFRNCKCCLLIDVKGLETDRVAIDERKSKSFEEREEEYLEARNRIFQQQQNVSIFIGSSYLSGKFAYFEAISFVTTSLFLFFGQPRSS